MELVTFKPGRISDQRLMAWVAQQHPSVVAIDAPLSMPHSVTCTATWCPRCEPGRGEYLARDIDAVAGGMPTVMLAAIMFRGIYLARLLRATGITVIETYPRAAFRAWGVGPLSSTTAEESVAARVTSYSAVTNDERDAVAAALASADDLRGRAVAVEGIDGIIWLPAP